MHCLFSDGLLLKLSCREGIDHPAGIKLCFSCDEHSVMHIPDMTDIMGIRIDGGEQPGLSRFVAVTPVQIESSWIGIDFDRDTSFGSELYQMIEVQFTLVAPKE